MVCHRCILAVKAVLDKLSISYTAVRLGEVELPEALSADKLAGLSAELAPLGFSLIDDRKSRIIEKVKNAIIELVHYSGTPPRTNLSDYLEDKLHFDYPYLSSVFSEVEGMTIEKYMIAQRIEKVKELLVYDEMTLGEIADRLGYSSVAYLSNQFKKVTGLTTSHFKKIRSEKRISLDLV